MRETKLWIWHMATGLVLLVLLGIHIVIMHMGTLLRLTGLGPGEPLAFAHVVARGRMTSFLVTYVLLLRAALFHGLFGLRTILLELTLSPRSERVVTLACFGTGVAFLALGTWGAVAAFLLSGGPG